MTGVEVKSFENADEVNNNFNNAKIEAVKVGNQRVMKLLYSLDGNGQKILNQQLEVIAVRQHILV